MEKEEIKQIKSYLQKIIVDTVREMPDFRNCLRIYKGEVISLVSGSTNRIVKLNGEDTTINIPVASAAATTLPGDTVLIATIGNSLSTAFILDKIE